MLEQILESRSWLACWLAGLALLNYSVGLLMLGEYARQPFLERDGWRPPGVAGRARSDAAQLALSLAATGLVAVLALFANRLVRETLVGGMLVVQMATLASNVGDLLAFRALTAPDAAEGHLRYSPVYRYRAAAARMIGLCFLTTIVGVLFWSMPFLVGSALLLATAGGWYRRASQAARSTGEGAK
jgi:hypothetical protein